MKKINFLARFLKKEKVRVTKKRRLGDLGEDAACKYLKERGYKILERNYRAGPHEIDAVAYKDGVIAFVEVKTRSTAENQIEPRPGSSVNRDKQQSIISAARKYVSFRARNARKRFDVIEVYAEYESGEYRIKEIKHLEGAFNLNTAYKGERI